MTRTRLPESVQDLRVIETTAAFFKRKNARKNKHLANSDVVRWPQAFFSMRVIATRITAPINATMIEPSIPLL